MLHGVKLIHGKESILANLAYNDDTHTHLCKDLVYFSLITYFDEIPRE